MKLELTIPVSWEDITLKQYKEFIKLLDKYDLSTEIDILEYKIDQLLIINPDVKREEILKLTMSQITRYINEIDFTNVEPVSNICKELTIDGKKYTFNDFKLMSMEQWIDADTYRTSLDTCNKLIAIFYIKPEEYNQAELDKVSEWLDNSPVTNYFWSCSFFLFMHKALELSLSLFSEKMSKNQKKIEKVIEKSKKIDQKIKSVRKYFTSK